MKCWLLQVNQWFRHVNRNCIMSGIPVPWLILASLIVRASLLCHWFHYTVVFLDIIYESLVATPFVVVVFHWFWINYGLLALSSEIVCLFCCCCFLGTVSLTEEFGGECVASVRVSWRNLWTDQYVLYLDHFLQIIQLQTFARPRASLK